MFYFILSKNPNCSLSEDLESLMANEMLYQEDDYSSKEEYLLNLNLFGSFTLLFCYLSVTGNTIASIQSKKELVYGEPAWLNMA